MSGLHAVIFDLDDTLYPECSYVLSGFRAVAAWIEKIMAIPEVETIHELGRLFTQGVRGDTFHQWLEQRGVDRQRDELVRQMVAVYREHDPVLTPFDGMKELLADLGRQYKLGVITDGYLAVQQRKWKALSFNRTFQSVVFSDAFGRQHWKPSHVPFEVALKALQVSPETAVYVGDNPAKDFLGARAAGLSTIRFRSRGGEHALAEPPSSLHAPDRTVDRVDELRACILELASLKRRIYFEDAIIELPSPSSPI